jgi:3-phenylpropionate/trans-cinnamate dioxygenase ferredoxin subunit
MSNKNHPPRPVASVHEIPPGTRKLVDVDGRSIGIFNVHGTFVAVLNICPHAFAPVCLGRVGGTTQPSSAGEFRWGQEGEILFCPWHGWEFELLTGKSLVDRRHLTRYPVYVEDDTIFVRLQQISTRERETLAK